MGTIREVVRIREVFVSPPPFLVGFEISERDEPYGDAGRLGRHALRVTLGKVHTVDARLNPYPAWRDTRADDAILAKEKVET